MSNPTPQLLDLRTINKPTKRQRAFIENWLLPDSDTFGNAYQSALKAGYKESMARVITGNAKNLEWVQNAKQLYASLEPEHIYLAIQTEALTAKSSRDRLRGLELMAKIRGLTDSKHEVTHTVKFTNAVPRPVRPIIEATE